MIRVLLISLAICGGSWAQSADSKNDPKNDQQEMVTHDASVTFQSGVNLVLVPVVVRDRDAHAIGTLKKEDFQLFDNGKPQVISKFSVEKSGGTETVQPKAEAAATPGEEGKSPTIPGHFIAYLFDDLHLDISDLMQVRIAAGKVMAESLNPTTRIAVYTTSGLNVQDFTDDLGKLQEALRRLLPRSRGGTSQSECPYVSYYMADAIVNKNDPNALQAATYDAMACLSLSAQQMTQAQQEANAAARRTLNVGDMETRTALGVLKDVVRRLAALPGQRSMILVSPGFITPMVHPDVTEVIDRAIRTNVSISSLDARGLYTTMYDASVQTHSAQAEQIKSQYNREAALAQEDVLSELADGTGGSFFHNNNDLSAGFRRLATAPEYVYVLGFPAEKLKPDGKFHRLKVTVKEQKGLSIQARRGYYSPKHTGNEGDQTKQAIEEAVFSRDENSDFPISLKTQFFKSDDVNAKLTVVTHVDLKHLRFRKDEGRNRNDLTVVSAVFDRNGNYIAGKQYTLAMRLKDENLENKLASGVTVRTSFDVKTGDYLLRLVVRDSEGNMMSTANSTVEIP